MAWEYWVCGGLYLDTVMLFRRWLVVQVSYFMFLSPINSQKFTLEEENNNLVGSNCFNILKAKRAFCATLGLRSVSVGMRGRLFSSHWGGLATTFAALGWCSSPQFFRHCIFGCSWETFWAHCFNGVLPVIHRTVFYVIFTLFTMNSFTEVYRVD